MSLDIHSAVTISAILSLMLALSLRYVLADYPQILRPGLSMWIVGMAVQTAAWVLYGLRGQVADVVAIVLANTLLALSYACQQHALRRFVALPRNAVVYAPVLLVAVVEVVFTFWLPSMRGRTVSASLLFALQFASCVAVLVRGGRPLSRSASLTATAFVVPALILVVRAAYEGTRTQSLPSVFVATPAQMIVFGMAAFMPMLASLGFVSMCNERLNQELRRQAMLDPLTGIGNRRALVEAGELAVAVAARTGASMATLLVDADHFKAINDRHGHDAGDAALCTLVEALRGALSGDDRLGRFGGEEFIVLLPAADEDRAEAVAERLRLAVEAVGFSIRQSQVPLRVSVGVAVSQEGDDFASLLRRADQAMYFAKRRGRNCVVGPRQMRRDRLHERYRSDVSPDTDPPLDGQADPGRPQDLSTEPT